MSEPTVQRFGRNDPNPLVSIIVLNYNGEKWLKRCFETIRAQTVIEQIEFIFADNQSTDNSIATATRLLADFPCAAIVQTGGNLGFSAGNNVGAKHAHSKYLFFLNSDTWLETDAIEKLMVEMKRAGATAATPLVLNYDDQSYQDMGFYGFDIFGLPSPSRRENAAREIFAAGGCSLIIERQMFERINGFDAEYFMYSEDLDLSWRTWIAGGRVLGLPAATVHHRGAVSVNPAGGEKTTEFRTTVQKRFLTNRNTLLCLLKNCRHILLLLVPAQIFFLALESFALILLLREPGFFRGAFLRALADCWRLRGHIMAERRRIAGYRQHGDFWMLRFFRWKLNRWFEIKRLFHFGVPRVDNR